MLCVPTVSFSEEDRVLLSIENRQLSSEDRVLSSEYRALSSEYTTPSSEVRVLSVEVRVLWSQDSVLSNEFRVLSRFVYYIILYLPTVIFRKKGRERFSVLCQIFQYKSLRRPIFAGNFGKISDAEKYLPSFFEKYFAWYDYQVLGDRTDLLLGSWSVSFWFIKVLLISINLFDWKIPKIWEPSRSARSK